MEIYHENHKEYVPTGEDIADILEDLSVLGKNGGLLYRPNKRCHFGNKKNRKTLFDSYYSQ